MFRQKGIARANAQNDQPATILGLLLTMFAQAIEILGRNIDTPIDPEFMAPLAPPLRTVAACETSRPSIPTATTA
jgi:hypothetical protein